MTAFILYLMMNIWKKNILVSGNIVNDLNTTVKIIQSNDKYLYNFVKIPKILVRQKLYNYHSKNLLNDKFL